MIDLYPHVFHNDARLKSHGPHAPKIEFPNMGTQKGGLLEFPLLRSPRGVVYGEGINPKLNPDRVVFRILGKSVTFMGVMSHAGNLYQGLQAREFVVSGFYY